MTGKHPHVRLEFRTTLPTDGGVQDVVEVFGLLEEEADGFRRDVESHPLVQEATALPALPGRVTLLVRSHPASRVVVRLAAEAGAYPMRPARAEDGWEHWSLAVPRGDGARRLVERLGEAGLAEVLAFGPHAPETPVLTVAQRKALEVAVRHGYYRFPRRSHPEALARHLGIAKSTFLEHLRKAEAKVLAASMGGGEGPGIRAP